MTGLSDSRRGDLEALASKSTPLAALLGLLLGPLGYVYVGSWRWAVINFFTFNYLLLGVVLVPLHTVGMRLYLYQGAARRTPSPVGLTRKRAHTRCGTGSYSRFARP